MVCKPHVKRRKRGLRPHKHRRLHLKSAVQGRSARYPPQSFRLGPGRLVSHRISAALLNEFFWPISKQTCIDNETHTVLTAHFVNHEASAMAVSTKRPFLDRLKNSSTRSSPADADCARGDCTNSLAPVSQKTTSSSDCNRR